MGWFIYFSILFVQFTQHLVNRDTWAKASYTTFFLQSRFASNNILENDLKQMFSRYGVVEFCKLMRNQTSGNARGYGFVAISNIKMTPEEIIQELNGKKFGKATVWVCYAPLFSLMFHRHI